MPTRKKTAPKKTATRKEPKPAAKASKPSQLDRIEAKTVRLDRQVRQCLEIIGSYHRDIQSQLAVLRSGSAFMQELDKAKPKPEGLRPGDYTDASKETADALTAMGWGWVGGYCEPNNYIWRSQNVEGDMYMAIAVSDKWNHLDPATFLRRAAVTAKALGLVSLAEQEAKANADKLAKLKFGVRVKADRGEGVYWQRVSDEWHDIAFPDALVSCSTKELTVIDPQP